MNLFEPEKFEADLKRLQPARVSEDVVNRTVSKLASPVRLPRAAAEKRFDWNWMRLLRWVVPASVAATVVALCLGWFVKHQPAARPEVQNPKLAAASPHPLKADKVEIDRKLVADFDAITRLPGGEPVRFRCKQWLERVRWRDSAKGVLVEQTTPRLEMVPVRFETY
jgi:hypothetical protein